MTKTEALKALLEKVQGGTAESKQEISEYIAALAEAYEQPAEYALPAATNSALGGVKKAVVTPLVTAANATAAAGSTITKAEFDKVVALANESKAKLNAVITAQRSAGQSADK